MSENKFTPGPWSIVFDTDISAHNETIATVAGFNTSKNEDKANANLIAAAPELLEALEPFAQFACSPPGECECHNCHARDVIAKARGLP